MTSRSLYPSSCPQGLYYQKDEEYHTERCDNERRSRQVHLERQSQAEDGCHQSHRPANEQNLEWVPCIEPAYKSRDHKECEHLQYPCNTDRTDQYEGKAQEEQELPEVSAGSFERQR